MRVSFLTTFIAAAALFAACGGYSSPSAPTSPAPSPAPSPSPSPSPAPSGQVTVDIVGSAGSQSFTPNPVTAAAGAAVAFKNDDSTIHHIVLDNGSADLGNVSPGQTTRSVTVSGSGVVGFHCTIHPSMVGTIRTN
jgi:plastocyanin